jgi:hypothetical protein
MLEWFQRRGNDLADAFQWIPKGCGTLKVTQISGAVIKKDSDGS